MNTLLYLIVGHYVADFALQNDFVAKNKAPTFQYWIHVMTAHCSIQAGTVLLATGRSDLAVAEFGAHFITDYLKCRGVIGFTADQLIHLGCRIAWFFLSGGFQ